MKIDIETTPWFDEWFERLRNPIARIAILRRIRTARHGHWGDIRWLDHAVIELRIHTGPGYRIYLTRKGERLYLLIGGGDKSSQKRDIEKATEIALALKDQNR
jgi:putative addiction module killer protein